MIAEAEQARLLELTKKLEKDLYKVISFLKNTSSNQPVLDALKSVELIEKTLESNPSIRQKLESELKSKNLLSLFKEFSFLMNKSKSDFDELQEKIMKADLFLESRRTYRVYSFDSLMKASDFIEKSLSMLGITNVLFKPHFIGMIDLKQFSEELNAEKQGSQLILLQEKIAKLFALIEKTKMNKSFKLESETLRILFKAPSEIIVETDAEAIKRLDHLARELEGSFTGH